MDSVSELSSNLCRLMIGKPERQIKLKTILDQAKSIPSSTQKNVSSTVSPSAKDFCWWVWHNGPFSHTQIDLLLCGAYLYQKFASKNEFLTTPDYVIHASLKIKQMITLECETCTCAHECLDLSHMHAEHLKHGNLEFFWNFFGIVFANFYNNNYNSNSYIFPHLLQRALHHLFSCYIFLLRQCSPLVVFCFVSPLINHTTFSQVRCRHVPVF